MGGRRIGRSWLLAGTAVCALAAATVARAATADDAARDARIANLEAAVAQLQALADRNQQLEQHDQALEHENAELKGEVSDLQAQVSDLKATTVTQLQDVRQTADAQPKLSFSNGRPTFSTADGKFTASLRGVAQLDIANYAQDAAGPTSTDFRRDGPALGTSGIDAAHARDLKDGTLWRRARIGIDGTAWGDFDYRILFDFGGSGVENSGQLYEAWAQYSGLKPFRFRVGAFPQPIGLEDQGSTNAMLFLERPGIADVARNLAAGDTRIGGGAFAYEDSWFASAYVTGRTVGVVNTGTVTGAAQSFGDQLGLVGRVAFTPFHGQDWRVNLGVHGSYVIHPADASGPGTNGVTPVTSFTVRLRDTPELRVDGTQFIDTGSISASNASTLGGELALQKGPFFVQGEYESLHVGRSDGVASPTFSGWYVEGSWLLTGERRAYNPSTAAFDGPAVAHPFSLKDHAWGAFELALRYSDANLNFDAGAPGTAPNADAIRGGDQRLWSAGLNWYFNPVFRVMLDIDRVTIDRLSPNAAAYSTPTGAQVGQSFTAVAVRTQAAF